MSAINVPVPVKPINAAAIYQKVLSDMPGALPVERYREYLRRFNDEAAGTTVFSAPPNCEPPTLTEPAPGPELPGWFDRDFFLATVVVAMVAAPLLLSALLYRPWQGLTPL